MKRDELEKLILEHLEEIELEPHHYTLEDVAESLADGLQEHVDLTGDDVLPRSTGPGGSSEHAPGT